MAVKDVVWNDETEVKLVSLPDVTKTARKEFKLVDPRALPWFDGLSCPVMG